MEEPRQQDDPKEFHMLVNNDDRTPHKIALCGDLSDLGSSIDVFDSDGGDTSKLEDPHQIRVKHRNHGRDEQNTRPVRDKDHSDDTDCHNAKNGEGQFVGCHGVELPNVVNWIGCEEGPVLVLLVDELVGTDFGGLHRQQQTIQDHEAKRN